MTEAAILDVELKLDRIQKTLLLTRSLMMLSSMIITERVLDRQIHQRRTIRDENI